MTAASTSAQQQRVGGGRKLMETAYFSLAALCAQSPNRPISSAAPMQSASQIKMEMVVLNRVHRNVPCRLGRTLSGEAQCRA